MGLGSKLKKLKKKLDPIGTKAEKATNKALGLSKKKSSTPSATTSASAGGSGPRTTDMGAPMKATPGGVGTAAGGAAAMNTARKRTSPWAGARSGVGRMQKIGK